MTPLAGFVAAIIAGWIVRDPRRAAAATHRQAINRGCESSAAIAADRYITVP